MKQGRNENGRCWAERVSPSIWWMSVRLYGEKRFCSCSRFCSPSSPYRVCETSCRDAVVATLPHPVQWLFSTPSWHSYAEAVPLSRPRRTRVYESVYMTMHLLPPAGSPGFWLFSTSAIIKSKAFWTFSLYRALASVQAHLNSAARAFPSSGVTWRCVGLRSHLFPTMTRGTHSVPYTLMTV